MNSFSELEPGLYQVGTPQEIQVVESEVVLREDDHFWVDKKRQQVRGEWQDVVVGLRTATDGLRIQAEALGVHVTSRIVEMSPRYCRAEATGYRLRSDGMLEVYSSAKEYDLTAELAKAALKKVPRDDSQKATSETSQALVKIETEAGALALVSTLPPKVQVDIMQARLEVQAHRLGLCETKAANRVLRYFIGKGGGILKIQPGFKEKRIVLQHAVLIRRLDPAQMKSVTESLYGQKPAQPCEPARGKPVEGEVVDDGEDQEHAEELHEEAAVEAGHLADEAADNGAAADEAAADEAAERPTPATDDAAARAKAVKDMEDLWQASWTAKNKGQIEDMPPGPPAKDAPMEDIREWLKQCRDFLGTAKDGGA